MDELTALLAKLFADSEGLRKFLAQEPGGEALLAALPPELPWRKTPARVARELIGQERADAGFFGRLRAAFPGQAEAILFVGERFRPIRDETLMQGLRMLLDAQLMGLVAELGAPAAEMPSIYAPLSARAMALMDWVKGQPGSRGRLEARLRELVPAVFD